MSTRTYCDVCGREMNPARFDPENPWTGTVAVFRTGSFDAKLRINGPDGHLPAPDVCDSCRAKIRSAVSKAFRDIVPDGEPFDEDIMGADGRRHKYSPKFKYSLPFPDDGVPRVRMLIKDVAEATGVKAKVLKNRYAKNKDRYRYACQVVNGKRSAFIEMTREELDELIETEKRNLAAAKERFVQPEDKPAGKAPAEERKPAAEAAPKGIEEPKKVRVAVKDIADRAGVDIRALKAKLRKDADKYGYTVEGESQRKRACIMLPEGTVDSFIREIAMTRRKSKYDDVRPKPCLEPWEGMKEKTENPVPRNDGDEKEGVVRCGADDAVHIKTKFLKESVGRTVSYIKDGKDKTGVIVDVGSFTFDVKVSGTDGKVDTVITSQTPVTIYGFGRRVREDSDNETEKGNRQ